MSIYKYTIGVVFMFLWTDLLAQQQIKWIVVSKDTFQNENKMVRTIQKDSVFYRELENLKQFYQTQGYLNPQFQHTFSDTLITTRVDLQKKTNFLVFNFSKKEELENINYIKWINKNTGVIPFEKSRNLKDEIINTCTNNGYPFSKLILSNYHLAGDTLYVNMDLDKGDEKKIDKIIVTGYEKFPRKFIKNTLDLQENQLYSRNKTEQISNKIALFPFVKEIKKPEVFFTQDTTYVFIFLEKLKNNEIDGIIGLSNAKQKKGILLNGNFNLLLHNVLDQGESLKINWFSDGELSQNFSNKIMIPYILSTPISIDNELEFYKKDTTHFNLEEKITFLYKVKSNHAIGLNYSFFRSNINQSDLYELKNIKSNFFGITYEYNITSSDLFLPYKLQIENEIQTGARELSKQWKFKNSIQYVFKLTYSGNLIIKNETAILQSDRYYSSEVFKLGGINSIRGFKYKSIDATHYTFVGINYRYATSKFNFFELLSDNVYLKNQYDAKEFLYSLGLGYSTLIKNNQFSIIYFIGNQASLPISFNNSFLYLNFSQKF